MVKFWIYLGGGGGGCSHKTGLFLGVIYIYIFLRSRYRIGIFLGDWYISNIFGVVTDNPVVFVLFFFWEGAWEGVGVNSRWRVQAYI